MVDLWHLWKSAGAVTEAEPATVRATVAVEWNSEGWHLEAFSESPC